MTDAVRFRDFSNTPRALEFDADGEHYVCLSYVPPTVLQEMLQLIPKLHEDFGLMADFFQLAMPIGEAARIRDRMSSLVNPLTLIQALEIATWLVEAHSNRPLAEQPS